LAAGSAASPFILNVKMISSKKTLFSGGFPVLDIQMLGTGNAFSKVYDNNNALMYSNHFTLMVDCGITGPAALYRLGKTFADVDAILITHIHGDHVGGLEEFAFQMKFVYNRKPVLYVPRALAEPLWEHTLKGGLSQEAWSSIHDFFEVIELDEGKPYAIHDGMNVELIRTKHIPGKISYSLLFNDRFFYTADMRFEGDLLRRLVYEKGCETIFHDCQLGGEGVVHASLSDLLSLPDDIQERMYIMHYPDNRDEYIGRTGKMRFVERGSVYTV
jgi:ribonuclease BN (tRNA processing enzyme)